MADREKGIDLLTGNARQLINLSTLLVGGVATTLLSNATSRQHAVLAFFVFVFAAASLYLSVVFQYALAQELLGEHSKPKWSYKTWAVICWGSFSIAIVLGVIFLSCVV